VHWSQTEISLTAETLVVPVRQAVQVLVPSPSYPAEHMKQELATVTPSVVYPVSQVSQPFSKLPAIVTFELYKPDVQIAHAEFEKL
jgi:hypothetical protein